MNIMMMNAENTVCIFRRYKYRVKFELKRQVMTAEKSRFLVQHSFQDSVIERN